MVVEWAWIWACEEDNKAAEGTNGGEWDEDSPSQVGERDEHDGAASSQMVEELRTCRLDGEREEERPCRNYKNQQNVNLLQKKAKSKAAPRRTQE